MIASWGAIEVFLLVRWRTSVVVGAAVVVGGAVVELVVVMFVIVRFVVLSSSAATGEAIARHNKSPRAIRIFSRPTGPV